MSRSVPINSLRLLESACRRGSPLQSVRCRGRPRAAPKKRQFKFPTAFTVLAIVLLVVWVASFFVPPGTYNLDPKTGGPVPETYHTLPSCSSASAGTFCAEDSLSFRLTQLWIAPSNGLYGIESDKGFVGAGQVGALYGSAGFCFFVLAVGRLSPRHQRRQSIDAPKCRSSEGTE